MTDAFPHAIPLYHQPHLTEAAFARAQTTSPPRAEATKHRSASESLHRQACTLDDLATRDRLESHEYRRFAEAMRDDAARAGSRAKPDEAATARVEALATALGVRAKHRAKEADRLFEGSCEARTFMERYGAKVWRGFTIMSFTAMTTGIACNLLSSHRMQKVRRDASIAAANSSRALSLESAAAAGSAPAV